MSFTEIFGGNAVYPSDPTFLLLVLDENIEFQWPLEQNMAGTEVLAAEIEVTPDQAGRSITMPDARLGSTGYTTTFYNAGADSFTVRDAGGNTLATVASGTAWTLWLRNNTTANGLWRAFQMGAATSAANAADLAGAGLEADGTTLNEEVDVDDKGGNYTIVDGDRAKAIRSTGGVTEFTLPNPATVGANWFCWVKNGGNGSLTIIPASGDIDGAATLVLSTGDSTMLVSDGADFFTCGFGQDQNSVFDFLELDVSGTGDYTLTGSELNRISYELVGILTGNRSIIVPAAIQQYWIFNNTSGAFTLTIKAAGGVDAGVTVPQGTRIILYCDGTNVVNAQTNTASLPAVVQGDILYGSAPGVLSALPKSAVAQRVLTNDGTANGPSWSQVSILLGLSGYRSANKSAATGRTSTIVPAADPDLFLNGVDPGTYDLECYLSVGGTGGGFRWRFGQTGTITGSIQSWGWINGASVVTATVGFNTDTTFATLAGTNDEWLMIKARVIVSVSGNIILEWAQNTSNATPTTIFLGYLKLVRVG